jgi:hypothetical protein
MDGNNEERRRTMFRVQAKTAVVKMKDNESWRVSDEDGVLEPFICLEVWY